MAVAPGQILVLFLLWVATGNSMAFDCLFPNRDCGWSWSEAWTLLSAENTTALGPTAPNADAENNVKGLMLYYSADVSRDEPMIKVMSPVFEPNTLPTCAIQFALHMYQMDPANFKMVIKASNTTWESASFKGNSAHRWENMSQPIGVVTQQFQVILEILNPGPVIPSHVAIDNIRPFDCYDKREVSTECGPRQFQCYDLICIDSSQVCDTVSDCIDGEDEEQGCDEIPESAFCTFEKDFCGWTTSYTEDSEWIRRRGESPSDRTGPSYDHTYQNETGTYLVTKFPPGRTFGVQTKLQSPWFPPPPYYHRNIHSQFFNSCQVRFFFHKFGNTIGQLRVFSEEAYPSRTNTKRVEILRSYGNKGNLWKKATVLLPNVSNEYQLVFIASRGIGNGDIAIDDITLSPECFGIGVPKNESLVPSTTMESTTKETHYVRKYMFNSCGALGRLGPNETLCNNAYHRSTTKVTVMSETTLDGIQKWTVPESGLYTVFVKGAGGGQGIANSGKSLGASLRAGFDWMKGDTILILIGQKGIDACGNVRGGCDTRIVRRSIADLRDHNKKRREGGGGGGGGATYIFKIDDLTNQRIALAVAAGGGGLSAKISNDEAITHIMPHGLMPNSSILPINGYTGSGAGGGGGWDDNTLHPTSGESLREGGRGGMVCMNANVWATDGGFGGGGGGCNSGGGGGGYRGGDAPEVESPFYNGQGGTSFVMQNAIRTSMEPGSNQGDGSVVIVPAQSCSGCQYLCVFLDVDDMSFYCICPSHLTISIDGVSCNGQNGMSVSPTALVGIILGVVIFLSFLIIGIFFATAKYRKLQRSRDVSNQPLNSPDEQLSRLRNNIGGMVSENNPNYEFGGNTCTEQDLKKVPRENLNLFNALGNGAFGEVYEGTLKNSADNTEIPVAVKTLPELSSDQAVFDFLMEALIMSKFYHPNIVSFIGVCFDKMPRFIVLELLPGGDLKSFLRECRPRPNKQSTVTISDLLKIALDVATGCHYLEENHFVHRDIAARNCLLTTKEANRVVKIADFGMARDIYRADYYRKGGKAVLPVKWMPPEAFLDGVFTSKTDVWSFGVLLWEVISLGYMPYPGRGNQEVMQLVTSGGRLEPPTNCPAPIYHIMMQCWHPHPDQRPNFSTIIERLGYCLQDPDVINAVLPVFKRAPSMEKDTTVMRPIEDGNVGCLRVQRPDPGLLLSPGSEDYLIPTPRSSYSLNTDIMSSPSRASTDQLMELEQRRQTPSSQQPAVWETNFMTPDTPTEPKWMSPTEDQTTERSPMRRQGGYTQVPTEDTKHGTEESVRKLTPNGSLINSGGPHKPAERLDSLKAIEELPVAPGVADNANKLKSHGKSGLSLDPGALVRQMGPEPNSLTPSRYLSNVGDDVCVDVNCNTGSNTSLSRSNMGNQNRVSGPFDGYSGINPVA